MLDREPPCEEITFCVPHMALHASPRPRMDVRVGQPPAAATQPHTLRAKSETCRYFGMHSYYQSTETSSVEVEGNPKFA